MVFLPDHDVVSFPDAWGSFQKLGCVCVTRWQALWWMRLRPGSDDSSKLSACLRVQGIFVLVLVLLFFQMQGSNPSLVVCLIVEMFAFACVEFFFKSTSGVE